MQQPSVSDKVLLEVALDLTASLPTGALYQRLIQAVSRVFPCDAAALLTLQGEDLVPVALHGLAPELIGKRFPPAEHPRLSRIMGGQKPVRFAVDSPLPDPFDGELAADPDRELTVHACVGCSLYTNGKLVGVLALDALNPGAFDQTPDLDIETFAALAAVAMRNAALYEELRHAKAQQQAINRELVQEARQRGGEILGDSAVIERLRQDIRTVASSDLSVLITGETGTGKELVARTLHAQSLRAQQPMVHVNCAALPESLAESELFGHVKGAFTGATKDRMGIFELADEGTLFLDEIGELPLELQAKLLRALQQGEIQRVGADRLLKVDVRVIAATNRQLADEVERGHFRSDLYHRLRVFPLNVPPLREHKEDLPVLAGHFLQQAQQKLGIEQIALHPEAMACLQQYPWPGNIRELEHLLLRASLLARVPGQPRVRIDATHLELSPNHAQPPATAPLPAAQTASSLPSEGLRQAVDDYQRQLICQVLEQHGGNLAQAATFLKVDRGNLYRLAQRLGLK